MSSTTPGGLLITWNKSLSWSLVRKEQGKESIELCRNKLRGSRDGEVGILQGCRGGLCLQLPFVSKLRHPGSLRGIAGTGIATPSLIFSYPHYGEPSTFTFCFTFWAALGGR